MYILSEALNSSIRSPQNTLRSSSTADFHYSCIAGGIVSWINVASNAIMTEPHTLNLNVFNPLETKNMFRSGVLCLNTRRCSKPV